MKKPVSFFTVFIATLFLLISCEKAGVQDESTSEIPTTAPTVESEWSTDPTDSSAETQHSHAHAYGEWFIVLEATCTENGTKARVCSCGDKETETIAAISHEYINNVCSLCKQSDPNAFVPDYIDGAANTVGTQNALSRYTSQADYLYFSTGNTINKMKITGRRIKAVYKVTAGTVSNINVVGDWIYFYCEGSTVGKSYIAKVRTDGSGFEKIVSSVCVWEMLVAKDTVYYTTITEDRSYKDFAKDKMPLYCVSTNGGTPKQLHDGAVENMVADSTYIYFIHRSKERKESIVRIKHGSTNSSVLLTNKDLFQFSLGESQLFFFVKDKYSDTYSLASISTNGGSYTEYGMVRQYSEALHVVGNKVYYMGQPYKENGARPQVGLIEYDLTTKRERIVREEYEIYGFDFTNELLIFEKYNYESEEIESLLIYYASSNIFREVKLSQ